MGLAANQARLMSLIARKSDIELEAQFISQHRMQLANMVSGLFNLQSQLEMNSPGSKNLDGKIQALQQADKVLEMRLNNVNTQRDAISKDLEGLQNVIKKNIENSFGLLGRR